MFVSQRKYMHARRTCHCFAELLRDALQVLQRDLASLIIVKQVKHLLDILARVLVALYIQGNKGDMQ